MRTPRENNLPIILFSPNYSEKVDKDPKTFILNIYTILRRGIQGVSNEKNLRRQFVNIVLSIDQ